MSFFSLPSKSILVIPGLIIPKGSSFPKQLGKRNEHVKHMKILVQTLKRVSEECFHELSPQRSFFKNPPVSLSSPSYQHITSHLSSVLGEEKIADVFHCAAENANRYLFIKSSHSR